MRPRIFGLVAATLVLLSLLFTPKPAASDDSHFVYLPLITAARLNPLHQGEATYYYADGSGACSFDPSPNDLMVAAMNAVDYNNAFYCGAYLQVTGPDAIITLRIVDLCPGCNAGDLDLSQEAFAQIAPLYLGRVPISWRVISPAIAGPIAYHFKENSNQWWTAVQIRNHRNPITKFEYWTNNQWVAVPRVSYNYFVQSSGLGVGPYTFRVTDMYSHTLTDSGVSFIENGTINGAAQFPPGP